MAGFRKKATVFTAHSAFLADSFHLPLANERKSKQKGHLRRFASGLSWRRGESTGHLWRMRMSFSCNDLRRLRFPCRAPTRLVSATISAISAISATAADIRPPRIPPCSTIIRPSRIMKGEEASLASHWQRPGIWSSSSLFDLFGTNVLGATDSGLYLWGARGHARLMMILPQGAYFRQEILPWMNCKQSCSTC